MFAHIALKTDTPISSAPVIDFRCALFVLHDLPHGRIQACQHWEPIMKNWQLRMTKIIVCILHWSRWQFSWPKSVQFATTPPTAGRNTGKFPVSTVLPSTAQQMSTVELGRSFDDCAKRRLPVNTTIVFRRIYVQFHAAYSTENGPTPNSLVNQYSSIKQVGLF